MFVFLDGRVHMSKLVVFMVQGCLKIVNLRCRKHYVNKKSKNNMTHFFSISP